MGKTPVKTRKSKVGSLMSTLEARADASFVKCPAGHTLPNKTERGKCTPIYCADQGGIGLARLRDDREINPEERVAKVKGDESMRIKVQHSRAEVWQDFLKIPVDLRGADAEKYADDELASMLPFAVGVVKKQLLYGTEEQQERAATKVLEANGRGKREAQGNSSPSIVINMVAGDGKSVTVDGKTVGSVDAKPSAPALPWRKAEEK